MSHVFSAVRSHIRLPKQKQEAVLARLNDAISHNPLIRARADRYLYEYRRLGGGEPLPFDAVCDLWEWVPTFDPATGDLIGMTSDLTQIEDVRTLHLLFDILAKGLDDGNYVEVEIDHQRRRYVSFQGEMYSLDATYVYPDLHKVLAQTTSQREAFPDEQIVLTLPNGYTLRSGGCEYELGAYARICDEQGLEMAYWDANEWAEAPEEVMGAIFGALLRFQRYQPGESHQTNALTQERREQVYVGEVDIELTGQAVMRQWRSLYLEVPLSSSAVLERAKETARNHRWEYEGMQDETIEVSILAHPSESHTKLPKKS